jgi:hypothetical protein
VLCCLSSPLLSAIHVFCPLFVDYELFYCVFDLSLMSVEREGVPTPPSSFLLGPPPNQLTKGSPPFLLSVNVETVPFVLICNTRLYPPTPLIS